MTNGEKIRQAFPDLQIDVGELEVYMWTTTHDTIDIPLEWWNAEYKEPTTKNDLGVDCISRKVMRDLGATCIAYRNDKQELIPIISIDELPSVTPQLSSELEKNSKKLEDPTKKYCGCCKHWKIKGVKKIGDKPTSYGKCTKLSISGFKVETTFNDDCSLESLE